MIMMALKRLVFCSSIETRVELLRYRLDYKCSRACYCFYLIFHMPPEGESPRVTDFGRFQTFCRPEFLAPSTGCLLPWRSVESAHLASRFSPDTYHSNRN
jgi:hypothetical protein